LEQKYKKNNKKLEIMTYLERKINYLEAQNSIILENQRILAKNALFSKRSNLESPSEDNFIWLKEEFVKKIEELKAYVDSKIKEKPLKQENIKETNDYENFSLESNSTTETNSPVIKTTKIYESNIISQNKKDWVKQKIMDVVERMDVDMIGLKTRFVDEKKYCSRATLYRHVKELQKFGLLSVVVIDNRTLLIKNQNRSLEI
jgi:hypothetical protein